ncbi:TIGR03619 family F420-dependent LLM class oxidoreductase [Amycolatopsis sp. NPDC059021]|uniref:TIGR03619 family F420-dependent LLM class oxidoreductase n=1 Tax=Amycolatopsis sp. NPDC059021 TaxID=3346704 RepID=UPI003671F571
MKLGLALPQYGKLAAPGSVASFASAAESLGFASLWVGDRVLTPKNPSDRYPGGTPEQPYPPEFTRFADPFLTLAAAAGATKTARLGTSTLIAPVYSPVLLARTLTTLDQASGGRLDAGFGIGWMRDEYAATGTSWPGRGKQLDELLDVLGEIWSGTPGGHESARWRIPESTVDLRPVQRPGPPVLLGGMSETALRRIGKRADGWLPAWQPPHRLDALWEVAVAAAEEAGRDPGALRRVLRLNPSSGSRIANVSDAAARLAETRDAGYDEAFVDLHYLAHDVTHALELATELRDALK